MGLKLFFPKIICYVIAIRKSWHTDWYLKGTVWESWSIIHAWPQGTLGLENKEKHSGQHKIQFWHHCHRFGSKCGTFTVCVDLILEPLNNLGRVIFFLSDTYILGRGGGGEMSDDFSYSILGGLRVSYIKNHCIECLIEYRINSLCLRI